ncbi:MAG: hypothetical protein C00003105_00295 [ANME-2 cluster archaeon HR1]|nr:MAG: hypothetical protein C00003105_00295 [ANME-2 cluster archaeon HR1]
MNRTPIFQIGYSPQTNIDVEKVERIVSFGMYDLPHTYNRTDFNNSRTVTDMVKLPISAYRICIESGYTPANSPTISINVTNGTSTIYQMNTTTYPTSDMPVIFDLSEELNKYDDSLHNINIAFNNTIGYCYSSHAGDLVGDKLAAKLIVQVW